MGGLLVALAALGVFAAWQGAAGGPTTRYAVAARALRPGEVVAAGDVVLRPADLPAGAAAHAFTDVGAVTGAVVLGPVAQGELVQEASLARPSGTAATPAHELSFSVAADRAVSGTLLPGERIAVLATYGTGAQALTETVVTDALLVDVVARSGGIDGDEVVLTVAVPSPDAVLALTHATRAGEVTVVRSTLAGDADLPARHRAAQD